MNAQEFINLLNDLNVLDAGAIADLRNQSVVAGGETTPQHILKSLLDSGQITREQAKQVLKKKQQVESEMSAADDEVIDLSQVNLSNDTATDHDDDVIDLSQLSDAANEDEEIVDLDQFGADQPQDESKASDGTGQDRYRVEDEEEEVNWGGMMIIGNALVFGVFCGLAVVLYIVLANHSARKTWESRLLQSCTYFNSVQQFPLRRQLIELSSFVHQQIGNIFQEVVFVRIIQLL